MLKVKNIKVLDGKKLIDIAVLDDGEEIELNPRVLDLSEDDAEVELQAIVADTLKQIKKEENK